MAEGRAGRLRSCSHTGEAASPLSKLSSGKWARGNNAPGRLPVALIYQSNRLLRLIRTTETETRSSISNSRDIHVQVSLSYYIPRTSYLRTNSPKPPPDIHTQNEVVF
jgi:hypothetical protein